MAEKNVLIVSGDSTLLRFLHGSLPARDYQVTSTRETGEELKLLLDKELPDLIILDIMMTSMDGIEVCLRIRQWSQVPIIMLSTWGASRGTVRGLDLSAEGYLTEPFDSTELIARIEEAFARNAAHNEEHSPNPGNHNQQSKLQIGFCCY